MTREADIEIHLCDETRSIKGAAYKFVSPGRRGVPDRLLLLKVPPEHQELVARYVRFVELKATNEDATPPQKLEHKRLRALGYTVHVSDSEVANLTILDDMTRA
jgi:hypothetical protein